MTYILHIVYTLLLYLLSSLPFFPLLFHSQERVIEQLKEKREKEEWAKQGEIEVCKKENKELKDKIASLQTQLLEKEVSFCMVKGHGLKVRTVTDVTNPQ